jgi:epoxyqueuosine reductase
VQFKAYYTDVPCDDNFYPKTRLDACAKCTHCRKNCPTGIITDAGAIDATRCLTMLNEQKGEFPAWLDPAAHSCLIGCMKCQESCPDNKEHMNYFDTVEFDEDETEFILSKFDDEPYPEPIAEKFKAISDDLYLAIIPRNLRALLRISADH